MPQVSFSQSSIAYAPEPAAANGLRMGALDAGAESIRLAELVRGLSPAQQLKRFVILAWLQANGALPYFMA
jgi:hypothetical protein